MRQHLPIPKIIAHRGASAYAPENTLAAFKRAYELGATAVEFDVMLSAEGKPFVIHDETLPRTTNGMGIVGEVSNDYLASLDAGAWFSKRFIGEGIPAFDMLVSWLLQHKMVANIEIKPCFTSHDTVIKTVDAILAVLDKMPNLKLLLSSFDYDALLYCHQVAPQYPLGVLFHEWDDEWCEKAKAVDAYSVHFNQAILTKARVAMVKQAGFQVYSYTVNSQRRAKKLFSWGVDAVFSDYPDLLSEPRP